MQLRLHISQDGGKQVNAESVSGGDEACKKNRYFNEAPLSSTDVFAIIYGQDMSPLQVLIKTISRDASL